MSTVLFKRGSTSDMDDTNIQDGLLFFNTETYKIYMDNGTERLQYGGDTDLISSAEDASLTNTFNAETSLGLFSQKATVVDSKANALSVTQNYIPLGCLAFKEALGTSDYSTVGNGTISGALVSLNTNVSNLNTSVSNLNNSIGGINGSIGELNNRTNVRGTAFYFDNQGGRWGWNSSSARGAGTFHPFRQNLTTVYLGGAGSYNISAYQSYDYILYYTVASISLQFSYGDGTGPRSASGGGTGLNGGGIATSGSTATFYAPNYSFNSDPSSPSHNVYGSGVCNINCYIAYG